MPSKRIGDVYERSGTLTSYSMGSKKIGKWRVQEDQLCLDLKEAVAGCYEVWVSGKDVELRPEGSNSGLDGVHRCDLATSTISGAGFSSRGGRNDHVGSEDA